MPRNLSVIGIYPDRITLADAMGVLRKRGYRATDIAVLVPDNPGSKDFAYAPRTKALEGAAWGAAAGAVVGAAVVWMAFARPATFAALGWLVAAGPALAVMAGTGACGALGWIVGFLAGLGRTEYVARRYAGRIRHGGILLSVHCDSPEWRDRAKVTLRDTGARNISSCSEAAADFAATDKPTERGPAVAFPAHEVPRQVEIPRQQVTEPAGDEPATWAHRPFAK